MRLKKRTVDRVIEENYWRGFFRCLRGDEDESEGLEYSSLSRLAAYDPIREIAFRHGVRDCLAVLADREKHRFATAERPEIPGRVYAEAYGEARIAKVAS